MADFEEEDNPLDRMLTIEIEGKGEFAFYNEANSLTNRSPETFTNLNSGLYLIPVEIAKASAKQDIDWHANDNALRQQRYSILNTFGYETQHIRGLEIRFKQFPTQDFGLPNKLDLDIYKLILESAENSKILGFIKSFIRTQVNIAKNSLDYPFTQKSMPVNIWFMNDLPRKDVNQDFFDRILKPTAQILLGDELEKYSKPEFNNSSQLLTWYSLDED